MTNDIWCEETPSRRTLPLDKHTTKKRLSGIKSVLAKECMLIQKKMLLGNNGSLVKIQRE
jgi:hypothetical protein